MPYFHAQNFVRHLIWPLLFAVAIVLGGCGFSPVYGTLGSNTKSAEVAFSQIDISLIPDREGQFLRNALIDRLHRNGTPSGLNIRYTLKIDPVIESLIDLDITKDDDTTRGQLRLETNMHLTARQTGEVILTRPLTAITSYNILGSEFATRISEENTRQNALIDLADQIERQLALYFARQN